MGKLSTHVLDTTRGRPGSGIAVAVFKIDDDQRQLIKSVKTNSDGRCDEPLLEGDALVAGVYELVFSTGPYFSALELDVASGGIRFLDDVVIRFGVPIADEHYHVPLLITPFSYSTYRGS